MPLSNPQQVFATPLIRFLDTNGNGTGTKNAIGNYAAVVTDFYIQPPAGSVFVINTFQYHFSDLGNFPGTVYANLAAALTNGVQFFAVVNGVTIDLFDGQRIYSNDNVIHLFSGFQLINFQATMSSIVANFNTAQFGTAMKLNGTTNDKLVVRLNDDFTGLVDQSFRVYGYY